MEKRPGSVKVEVLVVPLIILLTLVIDLKFIFVMTGISINMLLIGIVALCLGIGWQAGLIKKQLSSLEILTTMATPFGWICILFKDQIRVKEFSRSTTQ